MKLNLTLVSLNIQNSFQKHGNICPKNPIFIALMFYLKLIFLFITFFMLFFYY